MSGASTPSQSRFKNVLRALTPNAASKQHGMSVPPSPAGSDFEDDLQPPEFVSSFMKDLSAPPNKQSDQPTHLTKSNSWLSTVSVDAPSFSSSSNHIFSRPAAKPRHSKDNIASPTAQSSGKKVFGSSTWSRSKEALVGGLKRTNSSSSTVQESLGTDRRVRVGNTESRESELDSHKSPAPDKITLTSDATAHHPLSNHAAYHAKSTPGGPIHLGAGLSESSKRFRSAFRMRPRGDGMSTLRKPSRALVTEQPGAELDSESSPGSSHNASPEERDSSYNASKAASSASSPEDQALARSIERVQLTTNEESVQPESLGSASRDPLRSTFATGRLQHRLEAASLVPASSSAPSKSATPPSLSSQHSSPKLPAAEPGNDSPSRSNRGEKRKSPHVSPQTEDRVSDIPSESQSRIQLIRERSSPGRLSRAAKSDSFEKVKPTDTFTTASIPPKADSPPKQHHIESLLDRQSSASTLRTDTDSAAEKPFIPATREAAQDPENRVPSRNARHPSSKSAMGLKPQQASLGAPRAPLGEVAPLRQKHASSNGAPPDRVVPLKAGSVSPPEARDLGLGRPAQPPSGLPPPAAALPAASQPSQLQTTSAASGSIRKATHVVVNGKQYLRSALLGKGGSSRVYRITDREHNVFALKKVELGRGDLETYTSFCNEIELLKRLRGHDRIIQLVDSEVNEAKRTLIMILEIGEIDLNSLLQERIGKRISMNFIRQTWEQMLEAVKVVHDAGIVHTDLKPANFVLVKGALKLIDFGIAKAIPSDTTNIARDQQIGTANYMSPEALCDSGLGDRGERLMKMGRPSDVWSLGCILYQMVYGVTPFGHMRNLPQKMIAIQNPLHQIPFPSQAVPKSRDGIEQPELAVRIEADLLRTLRSCLRFESKSRSTIPQLLEDSFLRREDSIPVKDGDVVPLSLEMVSGIVARSIQWSAGRMPSRDEQQQFVDNLFSQLSAGMERV